MAKKVKTAIKPSMFTHVPALSKAQDAKGVTDEEKALYAMSVTSGWKVFEGIARDVKEQLNNINREAIASGAPMEEIGKNALVVNLAQDAITKLLNRVEDAVEACEAGE